MDYITRFKECCENGELMEMKFEDNLKNNYLKVISNIFYLNIGKVQLNFQRNYIDKKHEFLDDQDAYKKIQEIYNLSLKETRSNVCQFFIHDWNFAFGILAAGVANMRIRKSK